VGWRLAVLLVAALALALLPLVACVIRDSPRHIGLQPYGAPQREGATTPRRGAPGNLFVAALHTLPAGAFFICGASTNGLIGTHLIPYLVEHGMTEVVAASLLATIGAFDIVGTIASGWLSDRSDNRWLLVWYYALHGLALLFLPNAYGTGFFGLAIFVVFYGLDWVATVPPTVRLAADIFGQARAGQVYAWLFVAHQLDRAHARLVRRLPRRVPHRGGSLPGGGEPGDPHWTPAAARGLPAPGPAQTGGDAGQLARRRGACCSTHARHARSLPGGSNGGAVPRSPAGHHGPRRVRLCCRVRGGGPPVLSRHVVACSLVWRVGSLTSGKHADRHAPHQ
jgi:hypothetical protein